MNYTVKMFSILLDKGDLYLHLEFIVDFYLNLCELSSELVKYSQNIGEIIGKFKEKIKLLTNIKWILQTSKILKKRRFEVNQNRLTNSTPLPRNPLDQKQIDERSKRRMAR
jgi:hypothetical protein